MRFYFDLTDGQTVMPDANGAEAANLSEAIEQAGTVIEELRNSGELLDVEGYWQLVIREKANGQELHRLSILPSE